MYILAELDGSVLGHPIAAFRLVPYFTRQTIMLPPLADLIDISTDELKCREDATDNDKEFLPVDFELQEEE